MFSWLIIMQPMHDHVPKRGHPVYITSYTIRQYNLGISGLA